jgi:hypothetical protein
MDEKGQVIGCRLEMPEHEHFGSRHVLVMPLDYSGIGDDISRCGKYILIKSRPAAWHIHPYIP